ncbi:MAG: LysE family transporter [Deltaproteobacteria bacterium]|nr:LysE family transporter [Deltaproteobacteria bacterium]
MTAPEVASLIILVAAITFTPGPNTTLAAAVGANQGVTRALPFCVAVPIGWSVLMLSCILGLGSMLLAVPAVTVAVKWLGIAYLAELARRFATTANAGSVRAGQLTVSFRQGIALQFVNVKAWMLALTLTSGWVVPAARGNVALAFRLGIVLGIMVVFLFATNFAYAVVGSILRSRLAHGNGPVWINRVLALMLLVAVGLLAAT